MYLYRYSGGVYAYIRFVGSEKKWRVDLHRSLTSQTRSAAAAAASGSRCVCVLLFESINIILFHAFFFPGIPSLRFFRTDCSPRILRIIIHHRKLHSVI